MKPFDLLSTPLKGTNLIEASAGTGKTYTIAGLFVRLILEAGFSADQILVVTFTKAATEELKDRIRNKLLQARMDFSKGTSEDPFIQAWMDKSENPNQWVQTIQDALIDFDRTAIFTIHGFCQRILHEHAFETGSLYDTELITEPAKIIQEVLDDFWRKHFYPLPLEFVSYAINKKNISEPRYFLTLLEKARFPDIKIIPELEKPELITLTKFRKAFKTLVRKWPDARYVVQELLKNPALSGTRYGSLKTYDQTSGLTKRDIKVFVLIDRMDRFVDPKSTGYPLFKEFEKFTAAKLRNAVKKDHPFPFHEIFNICEELQQKGALLETEMGKYLLFLKTKLLNFVDAELSKRKKIKNIQFYDDLLLAVRMALKEDELRGSNMLAKTIRQKYKAALVDEFQDTDAVQYEIFSRLFASDDCVLFMIGDPKQSIYSFRGADVFSYMKASTNADYKYTLLENWRSDSGLITAVNTIFSNVKRPFVYRDISFEKGKPGNMPVTKPQLPGASIKLWYLPSGPKKPINKTDAVPLIAESVCSEILRLISSGASQIGTGDIAVLVRTNRQAQIIKKRLSARNIPAVLYSTGNIFDADEAMEMERVLSSISEPANNPLFRSALVTDMMGVTGEELDAIEKDSLWWENRQIRFRRYYKIWNDGGFIRMFSKFMNEEGVKERVLSLPDGERRLTNMLHLSEIIHQVSLENGFGMTGLLKWLSEQRNPSAPRLEEHQLRLESDERAVKIVTIHKSKGLEYPIVFCPFGWESALLKNQEIVFHGNADNQGLTLDLQSPQDNRHLVLAQNELLAENLRILYVALTRAKTRCYLVWGRINTAETSAMAYLFHGFADDMNVANQDDIVGTLANCFAARSDEDLLTDLKNLVSRSEGTIELSLMPPASEGGYGSQTATREKLNCRDFKGKIDKTWRVSSYTALVSRQTPDLELPDHDGLYDNQRDFSEAISGFSDHDDPPQQAKDGAGENIFSFPKGTRAGIFFHDLFEHLDFTENNTENLKSLVTSKLQEYRFDLSWVEEIVDLIQRVTSVPLLPGHKDFVLAAVPCENRINEMEFYFPLNATRPQDIKRIFAEHSDIHMAADFPAKLDRLSFFPASGFMKGYIDMIFEYNKRMYLVDWKSNHLGNHIEKYDDPSLVNTMKEGFYILQYHIYILALHQYMQLRKPGYKYERDFGGVFYVFLRGVDQRQGVQYGIFKDLPNPGLITKLGKVLIPGF
jgi:exodeoxyribonuclease V beta subunit